MQQTMKVNYLHLREKPIDPNRVKNYAFILSGAAALIALVTIKSNFDYFSQFYSGYSFWMRVIPFFAIEGTIITLPLVGGFGNHAQWKAAKICEVVLIALSLTHTVLVSQSDQAKILATKTKAEAQADYDRANTLADRIATQNQNLQDSYNTALAQWNRAATIARRRHVQPPSAPIAPQLMTVPQVNRKLIDNATLSTEDVVEAQVPHKTLMFLLFGMIGAVIGSATWIFMMADASRVRAWMLRRKARALNRAMKQETADEALEIDEAQNRGRVSIAQTIPDPGVPRLIAASVPMTLNAKTEASSGIRHLSGQPFLATLRQHLRPVSRLNPGMSFKVDTRGLKVFVRAMKSENGRQITAATIKLSESEARSLADRPADDCQKDLMARFNSQNLHLNV